MEAYISRGRFIFEWKYGWPMMMSLDSAGSSNGGHSGVIFFKPEKNLEFFRLKNDPRDAAPGRLE